LAITVLLALLDVLLDADADSRERKRRLIGATGAVVNAVGGRDLARY